MALALLLDTQSLNEDEFDPEKQCDQRCTKLDEEPDNVLQFQPKPKGGGPPDDHPCIKAFNASVEWITWAIADDAKANEEFIRARNALKACMRNYELGITTLFPGGFHAP
jgi:hypothetical protein